MKKINKIINEVAIYQAKSGAIELKYDAKKDTIWANLNQIADLFGVQKAAISKHLKNIFKTGELSEKATVSKMETVQIEGKRSGAFAFMWFLRKTEVKGGKNINPATLTALTLLIAESSPKKKNQMTALITQLLK